MDTLDDPERRIRALEFLADDREAEVVHPGSAPRLVDRRAEQPEFAHAREDLTMHLALFVPLADVRQDLVLGKVADGLLDELVLVGQAKVDGHGYLDRRKDGRPRMMPPRAFGVSAYTRHPCMTHPTPSILPRWPTAT